MKGDPLRAIHINTLILILGCLLATGIRAGAQNNVDVIVATSDCMKESVGGAEKMELVKRALAEVGSSFASQKDFRLGLRSCGGPASAAEACTESRRSRPIRQLKHQDLSKTVDSLEPGASAPLAHALDQAAGDFKRLAGKNHAVVIACSADTCGGDVCKAAALLAKPPVSARIHVILFSADEAAAHALECATQDSGGLFLQVSNEAELKKALGKALSATVPPNLELTILGRHENPVDAEVTLYRAGGTGEPVDSWTQYGVYKTTVPPGVYDIYLTVPKSGKREEMKNIEVLPKGVTRRIFRFQIGRLHLSSKDSAAEPIAALYTVYNAGTDEEVASAGRALSGASVELEPGKYDAKAVDPDTGVELWARDLEVKLGPTTTHTFEFPYGTLTVGGYDCSGEVVLCSITIYDASTNEKLLTRETCEEGLKIRLMPGVYDIEFLEKGGEKTAWLRGVEIKAGEKKEEPVFFE
jgi:hypothetical protein